MRKSYRDTKKGGMFIFMDGEYLNRHMKDNSNCS